MKSSMSGEQLKALVEEAKSSFKVITPPYWTSEIYGFGKWIRKYGMFPGFLPLCIFTDHGPAQTGEISPHELNSGAPVQFYHSPELAKKWQKISGKPVKVLMSPFVFCRKILRLDVLPGAEGTLAFPAHTTDSIDDKSDLGLYIDQLKRLPIKFQPVAICLHPTDIKKGMDKIFLEEGFPVFTAGNSLDDRFTERFYEILRSFKFTTSNIIGSYVYYSVEMGIPFFLYGQSPVWINRSDKNIPMGAYDPYQLYEEYRRVHDLFSKVTNIVSPEQREFVLRALGVKDGISRVQMSAVLYVAFIKWLFRFSTIKYLAADFSLRLRSLAAKCRRVLFLRSE